MAKNRCLLCDGKLNSDGRCTFCGLDNTKSDRYYRLNQSNCDDASFTHVHEDDGSVKNAKRIVRQGSSINGTGKAKTIREADWEINHKQARQKYADMNKQGANSHTGSYSYSSRKKGDYGINSDDYEKRSKRIRKFVMIFVIVVLLLQIIPVMIIQFSYSPELDSIRREIDGLFGSGSEQVWEDDEGEPIYLDPETDLPYEFDDGYFNDYDDSESLEEFLERYGDLFEGYDGDIFDEELIEPEAEEASPSDGML